MFKIFLEHGKIEQNVQRNESDRDMEFVFYKRPFINLDQDFLESDILKDCYQKVVYIYLKALADAEGRCSPSLKRLSRLTKISIQKVRSTISGLIQMGLVEKENRISADGGIDSNLYTVYDLRDDPNGKKSFIRVYKDFFENTQLDSCQQKLVYLCLGRFADFKEECYPSVKEISGLTKIGVSKVKSTINELEQKGMIGKKRIKIDKRNRNLYILLYNIRSLSIVYDKELYSDMDIHKLFGAGLNKMQEQVREQRYFTQYMIQNL